MQLSARLWKRLWRNKAAILSLLTLLLLTLSALLAPYLAPSDPLRSNLEAVLLPPGRAHWLGTDHLGRDLLSQIIWGARTSLGVAASSVVLACAIGLPVGGLAGYFGGRFDNLLMRTVDIFLVIPTFFLALVIVAIFGSSIGYLVLIMGFTFWPGVARLFRGAVLSVRNEEYVAAAVSIGASDVRVLLRHVAPNAIQPILVNLPLQAATVILIEAGLSFIGLGDPTTISWGGMLNTAQQMLYHSWWMPVFPGLGITVTILSLNFLGDGLLEAIGPQHR